MQDNHCHSGFVSSIIVWTFIHLNVSFETTGKNILSSHNDSNLWVCSIESHQLKITTFFHKIISSVNFLTILVFNLPSCISGIDLWTFLF